MRLPKYLSPSSLKTFEKNRQEFYLRYLADNRPERMPQTEPMSVGSSFDAHVKSYLHKALIGNYGENNEYELNALFEAQVEPQCRDFARAAGKYVFERYSFCGALSDMMLALQKSVGPPRFEFNLEGVVDSEIGNIPVLGKPDIFFINEQGARVIWDWKVNGFCGNSSTSPTKGYTFVRDCWEPLRTGRSASRFGGKPHKDCYLSDHLGVQINGSMGMEDCNPEWADQLGIYAWLLGEPIGSENLIVGIDQIVGCGRDALDASTGYPFLRVANHRTKISSKYQFQLHERLVFVWNAITTGYIFPEYSRDESDEKVAELDKLATTLSGDDEFVKFLNATSRSF